MARVVVTGGAGFLGSHLCRALLDRGDEVVAIDNLVSGSVTNIEELFGTGGFTFVEHDVSNYIWVPGGVDAVMHLASPASPVDFERIPIKILKVGSLGTHNGLGLALAKGAKFFLASTSEVYGDPLVHPQPEDYWGNVNPIGIRGVYDEAKRFAEAMTMGYRRQHGLNVRIVRIFNTYGPRMRPDDGRAVSNFLVQALRGQPITIYGDGSQSRSFTYVSDTVDGIVRALEKPRARGEIINVGGTESITILELAEFVQSMLGVAPPLRATFIPYETMPGKYQDVRHRVADPTKARELLGFEASVKLADGVAATLDWHQKRRLEERQAVLA